MKSPAHLRNAVCGLVIASFLLQAIGCGTLLYPERRGQKGGRIDAGVAVMDAAWLIVFIIPGVVAFIVDYSTGAIYLPGSHHSSVSDGDIRVIHLDPKGLDNETVMKAVIRETGIPAATDLSKAEFHALKGLEDVRPRLAGLQRSGYRPSSDFLIASTHPAVAR